MQLYVIICLHNHELENDVKMTSKRRSNKINLLLLSFVTKCMSKTLLIKFFLQIVHKNRSLYKDGCCFVDVSPSVWESSLWYLGNEVYF